MEDSTTEQYKLPGGYILKRRLKNVALRYVRYHPDKDSENHYREILMFFYPWRKEENLIGDSDSFEEQFKKTVRGSDIDQRINEYKHFSESLERALAELEEMEWPQLENGWDIVAPNTQHTEKQDEDEGVKPSDTFPEFQPSRNLSEIKDVATEIGGGCADDIPDVIVDMMKDDDYYKLLQSMNKKQREIFNHVLHQVKTDKGSFHIFITGGAGVGKSVIITAIHQALLRFLNKGPEKNPDEAKILLGAPTGIAAFLVKGSTLHSLFHIPANQGFTYKPLSSDVLNTYRYKFRHVKLLIIDEISVVGNKLLNYINRRLQQIMVSSEIFGGLSVLAVGDLYQLKPVFDGWIFSDLSSEYGPLAMNLWKENFYIYELDEVMRQKDDAVFASLLNRLRKGHHTQADIELLKTRIISTDLLSQTYPFHAPHIFTTNSKVRAHNDLVHTLSPASKRICINAIDVVVGDCIPTLKTQIKNSVPDDPAKTMGLVRKLQTAVGQRVEMCINVNVDDGLVNGAPAEVMAVTRDKNSTRPNYIWVKFSYNRVGEMKRQDCKNLYADGISKDWTPVSTVKRQFKVGKYKCAQVMREQFPLRPAAAKTAHRCQGSTMDSGG